jgi:hypothetical protein
MGARTVVVLEAENEQFPKELAQVRMEQDTVKKWLRTLPRNRYGPSLKWRHYVALRWHRITDP